MSCNKSEEDYHHPKTTDEVESPRKRMRLDNSSRKSWSLMDRRTDHEVLQEMGVSLLEPDDGDNTEHPVMISRPPSKRKHNIENCNPNVVHSPKKFTPKKCSPIAGPSRRSSRSPPTTTREKGKPLTETELNTSLTSEYRIEEETPLAQVNAHLPTTRDTKRDASVTPEQKNPERTSRTYAPSGPDSFLVLSDEVMMTVFKWLPKRTLAHCMLVCKRWYRLACDETLWQRLDLGNKTISKGALGRILDRKPVIVRLASSEIGPWHPPVAPPPSRIQYLDLSMCTVDGETTRSLLAACPCLRRLSLESVTVCGDTCRVIGKCTQLETLNLTMAQGITTEGLTHILNGCQSLQSLNISWTNLDESALQVLVTSLPQNLQRLNLAGARLLTDDMLSALSARCPRLVELDVSDCARISADGSVAMATFPCLEHLAVSRCYLMPASALSKLNTITSLQYLDVFGMLQPSSLVALRAALPTIQINQFMFSAIARPTVGTRRTSVWGLRTRD